MKLLYARVFASEGLMRSSHAHRCFPSPIQSNVIVVLVMMLACSSRPVELE